MRTCNTFILQSVQENAFTYFIFTGLKLLNYSQKVPLEEILDYFVYIITVLNRQCGSKPPKQITIERLFFTSSTILYSDWLHRCSIIFSTLINQSQRRLKSEVVFLRLRIKLEKQNRDMFIISILVIHIVLFFVTYFTHVWEAPRALVAFSELWLEDTLLGAGPRLKLFTSANPDVQKGRVLEQQGSGKGFYY